MAAIAEETSFDQASAITLADLRRARRRRRTEDFDVAEAVYRVYITAVVLGIAVWVLSGVVGDQRLGAATAAKAASRGPQVVGAVIGLGFAVGLRSGGRGGPLVIEAADVRHVLLSPVARAVALRRPALRQLRFGAAAGAGAGALAGLLAYRRLPGGFPAWLACGALVGGLAVPTGLGLAMMVSGRRVGRIGGAALGAAVAAWSAVDLAAHTTTSPATFLGDVALWPLKFRLVGLAGVAVGAVAMSAGLASVAGVSIEAAERRASLVGQIRFAATLRDLRTVVVLRRQLSQEQPRQTPWFRVPRSLAYPLQRGPAAGQARRFPVWRRGWHGIARFPGVRFLRMAVLGAVAGACSVAVYRGTTPLFLVAGGAMYVAGLDAIEPMAQEVDHPDRWESYTGERGILLLRQAGPSIVVMVAVAVVGVATAVAVTGGAALAWKIGLVVALPAALAGVGGATISVVQGAPAAFSSTDAMLPPEAAGARAIARIVVPPAVAVIGFVPVLVARHPSKGISSVGAAAGVVAPVLLVVALVGLWVRYRDAARAWFKAAMEEANTARKPPARPAGGH
ncbi:hypothetical protein K6U06_19365 [Acidiferrimicrobium sp. IK]|uniref:hypothetical protein n=1 Tax=Acidiferrimicrobium sp. IK TaxID=2871700 RepID=UPI0021CB0D16|nr:hypothetical protein [Acidiferrimicrobium sp. IK]MCU4186535.1 hypothetical protein [Acidiferrimicrobium sp. IK]